MSSAFEGLPKTPNLKLNKPGYDNVADIEALNENADILDAEIQGIKNTFVKSVNGKEPDAGGNVNVEEYTHPNSGVTAGTYDSVTVNAQGHVTGGNNPKRITDASISGRIITLTYADNTTKTLTTQDTTTPSSIASNISVTAGTLTFASSAFNGSKTQTIPLPSGYSRGQCKYIVSANKHSIFSYGDQGDSQLSVNQSNGVVTSYGKYDDNIINCVLVANYICIATK